MMPYYFLCLLRESIPFWDVGESCPGQKNENLPCISEWDKFWFHFEINLGEIDI